MNKLCLTIAAASLLTLGGCGKSDDHVSAKNASVDEVNAKVADAKKSGAFMEPGHWVHKMQLVDLDIPGEMPTAAREQMKASIGKIQTSETCLTPEEARNPRERFAKDQGDQCVYDHFEMGGGAIDAKMSCMAGGAKRVMTMTGHYSGNSYEMRMATTGEGAGPAAMSMTMRVSGQRTGDCSPGES